VLVDAGCGTKVDPKFRDIFAVERPEALLEDLASLGVAPKDITSVALTHLHFDHCGGGTMRGEDAKIKPTFPRARYMVRRSEWEGAHHANERNRASYLPRELRSAPEVGAARAPQCRRRDPPGVSMRKLPGHSEGHQGVFFDVPGARALYAVDLFPTVAHLPLPYIMAYDLYPLTTLETKRSVLREATREEWLILLEHDPDHFAIRVSARWRR